MVYVLIIVALFAALSFVLARQTDTAESNIISEEQAEIYAGTIIQATMQLKQSVEQMLWTGSTINPPSAGTDNSLDFMTPDDSDFETQPVRNKVFHPHGGGMVLPRIPDDAIAQISDDPPARWYIGRFNNVEWTPSIAHDVILTAHQINQSVCARINEKLTGSTAIPELAANSVREMLINRTHSTAVSNFDFDAAACAACEGLPALCVKDNGVDAWSFYSLIAAE